MSDCVTVSFGKKFAESDKFSAIFQEGMALVEDTAAYLDGDGRNDAKDLQPPASLAYATESMRLTTRLMQLASWLLIRRAVNEGELTPEQAMEEKTKVKLKAEQAESRVEGYEELPIQLRELIDASLGLNRRIVRLDRLLNAEASEQRAPDTAPPLGDHMARLQQVFGQENRTEFRRPR
jgi:regulator of CtrA degradation